MILKKGITGFLDATEPVPLLQAGKVRSFICRLTYSGRYRLMDFVEPGTATNYYKARLQDIQTKKEIIVLFNSFYPYYSGACPEETDTGFRFVDIPEDIRAYLDVYFIFLAKDILTTIPDHCAMQKLAEVEREQIEYWNIQRIGDVVFNHFISVASELPTVHCR